MKARLARILLVVLIVLAAALALLLWRLREQAAGRLRSAPAPLSLPAPEPGAPANVTFMVANDADGSLLEKRSTLALPDEPSARASAVLNALLATYAQPDSTHPIAANPGVDTVFLLALPRATGGQALPQGTLAVVNLSGALAQAHPSGIEPETLTLLSIIATLHANMPDIAEVRFLIDGQPRPTLAGHADLTHTYLASSSAAPVPEVPQPNAPAAGGARP